MKHTETTIADQIAHDTRPIPEWVECMSRLPADLYERDPELSRRAEKLIRRLASTAANLDCIGTDDPSAPQVGSAAHLVLAYIFRRWPKDYAEYRKVISRADQLLGRRRLTHVTLPPSAPDMFE